MLGGRKSERSRGVAVRGRIGDMDRLQLLQKSGEYSNGSLYLYKRNLRLFDAGRVFRSAVVKSFSYTSMQEDNEAPAFSEPDIIARKINIEM